MASDRWNGLKSIARLFAAAPVQDAPIERSPDERVGLSAGDQKSEISPPKKWNVRKPRLFIYPSVYGEDPRTIRKTLGAKVTKEMLSESRHDSLSASYAAKIRPFLDTDALKLKVHNVSRNHILADSRIRNIMEAIYVNRDYFRERPDLNRPQLRSVENFLKALSGDATGAKQFNRLAQACRSDHDRRLDFEKIVEDVCAGRCNIRFGNARTNLAVSNEFDPVVLNGRLSARSIKIRDAVIQLAKHKLIPHEQALSALAIVKDRLTHRDVTSTVLHREGVNTGIRDHTIVDSFAPAADVRALARRRSFDNPRVSCTVAPKAGAREWHGASRPKESDGPAPSQAQHRGPSAQVLYSKRKSDGLVDHSPAIPSHSPDHLPSNSAQMDDNNRTRPPKREMLEIEILQPRKRTRGGRV